MELKYILIFSLIVVCLWIYYSDDYNCSIIKSWSALKNLLLSCSSKNI